MAQTPNRGSRMPVPHHRFANSPWRLGGLSVGEFLRRSIQGFREHHLDARSAQFAYYSMLFIAPLLILLIAVLAQLPVEGEIEGLSETAGRALPAGADAVLMRQITDIQEHSTLSLVLFSLLVAGFAGSQLFMTVSRGLNAAYHVVEVRRAWQVHGLALLVTLGAFVLLLAALLLLLVGPILAQWLVDHSFSPPLGLLLNRGFRWSVWGLVSLTCASVIYWLAPSIRLRWSLLTPGSLFATLGWAATSRGFQFYVNNVGRYNETYGTIGGAIVLMVWLYLTGAVLMIGGQINSTIYAGQRDQDGRLPPTDAPR